MEYPSKAIVADDLATHRHSDHSDEGRERIWAALFEALVRAGLVIVGHELPDHRLQVAGAEDQHLVKHLSATHEPLHDQVRTAVWGQIKPG